MASEVCTSLGLVGKDLTGKVVHVAEEHGSESSFVLGSVMWNASTSGASLCVLALHNTHSHYQCVAKRLGYDLQHATFMEPFAVFGDKGSNLHFSLSSDDDTIKKLFIDVVSQLDRLPGQKCLVIDDLSDLLCLGASVAQVMTFLHYCHTLMDMDSTLALVVGTHFWEDDEDSKVVATAAAHMADCRLVVSPLKTGFSHTVTGTVQVDGRLFHYRLSDRQVKVFAPGSAGLQL